MLILYDMHCNVFKFLIRMYWAGLLVYLSCVWHCCAVMSSIALLCFDMYFTSHDVCSNDGIPLLHIAVTLLLFMYIGTV